MDFSYKDLPLKKLSEINFKINPSFNKPKIKGVYYKDLKTHVDSRGDLTELWSDNWIKKEPIAKKIAHVYLNTTHQGVTKAWHVHEKTYSQYTCVKGKMQIVLVDIRAGFKTFGQVDRFIIGTMTPGYIKIPPGVLKGWKSFDGNSIIVNLLTTSKVDDNFKYPWNSILKNVWEPKNG